MILRRASLLATSVLVLSVLCWTGALRSSAADELTPCGSNLIDNGSFERGNANVGSYLTVKAGSDDIDSWTVTTGSVDIVGSLWAATDGVRSIDLDGVSFGGLSQAFKTTKDKTYVVTFDLAGNRYGAPMVKRLKVTAAGQSADFSYDLLHRPATKTGWATHSFQFVAKGDLTTLEFDSLDTESGYFGPVIDNVIVRGTCTPSG